MAEPPVPPAGPKGVGAILTGPDGSICAHAFDFNLVTVDGFPLWMQQRHTARIIVTHKFIEDNCHPDIVKVISEYDKEVIVNRLCREHGYHLTYIDVGHGIEDITR